MRSRKTTPSRWSYSCCITRAWNPSAVSDTGSLTRHEAAQPGNRETTLPALFGVLSNRTYFRVGKHRGGNLGLVLGFRHPKSEEAKALRHLRCRETDAVFLDHRPDDVATEIH